jgi:molybdopterin-guanine dinucleotide biosynthesis protein
MTVCFVTGTDTGVGKTVVTAALAVILRARRKKVAVVEPTQTGVRPGEPGDVDEVRRCRPGLSIWAPSRRCPSPGSCHRDGTRRRGCGPRQRW